MSLTQPDHVPILIVGGGATGLTLSALLSRFGIQSLLVERNPTLLDDRIYRAVGILRTARLLGAEEAMKLLSRVRLGVRLRRLPGIELRTINHLLLQIQTAHLQKAVGASLNPDQRREARAKMVREALA